LERVNDSKFVEVESGIALHVTDCGVGKPIVLIHGWPLSDEIFKYQYQDLTERGYRVVGITLRGFGNSSKAGKIHDFDTLARDIHHVFIALSLEHSILLGFSFGGVVAVKFLTSYNNNSRVSKLVLLSSNVPLTVRKDDYPYGMFREQFDQIIAQIRKNRTEITDLYGPLFRLYKGFLSSSIRNWINGISAEASETALINIIASLRDIDLRPILYKIGVPTAIFHGLNDNVIPIEIAQEAHLGIRHSTLILFEEGGHWLFLKEREKFTVELLKFVNGVHNEEDRI